MFIWDSGSEKRIVKIYPGLRDAAYNLAIQVQVELNRVIRISQGLRTYDEQNRLYSQGRDLPGKVVTWVKGGESDHNFGLAFDISFKGQDPYLERLKGREFDAAWNAVGRVGLDLGLEWGGLYKGGKIDRPHFANRYGLSIKDLDKLYRDGGLKRVWEEIDASLGLPAGSSWAINNPKIEGTDNGTVLG